MKKYLVFAGVVAAGLVLTMAVANAQRPGGVGPRGGALGPGPGQGMGRLGGGRGPDGPMFGRGRGPGMMLAGLDLTEDQKAQVTSLFASEREASQVGMQALFEARKALHAAIFANVVDAGAISALQAKVAAAEQAQIARHVQTQLALSGILTPEQRAKLLARGGRGPGGPRGPEREDR